MALANQDAPEARADANLLAWAGLGGGEGQALPLVVAASKPKMLKAPFNL